MDTNGNQTDVEYVKMLVQESSRSKQVSRERPYFPCAKAPPDKKEKEALGTRTARTTCDVDFA